MPTDVEDIDIEDVEENVFVVIPTKALEHSFPPLYFRTDTCLLLLPIFSRFTRIKTNKILSI